MCLGLPMKILSIEGERALAETLGVRREISLALLPPPLPKIGADVLVHVGYAIEVIDAQLAAESRLLWQAMQTQAEGTSDA